MQLDLPLLSEQPHIHSSWGKCFTIVTPGFPQETEGLALNPAEGSGTQAHQTLLLQS